MVLPYSRIFQSGVLFLSYGFGLPVIGADVGALKEDIIEDQTGFVFKAGAADDLAGVIRKYFAHNLFRDLPAQRERIRAYANERYSWDRVTRVTNAVYSQLLGN
jgi:glycosyltransferase involved in cell wall biosynthesis